MGLLCYTEKSTRRLGDSSGVRDTYLACTKSQAWSLAFYAQWSHSSLMGSLLPGTIHGLSKHWSTLPSVSSSQISILKVERKTKKAYADIFLILFWQELFIFSLSLFSFLALGFGLTPALCSWIILGSIQGIIWGARDRTRLNHIQGKCPIFCTISVLQPREEFLKHGK